MWCLQTLCSLTAYDREVQPVKQVYQSLSTSEGAPYSDRSHKARGIVLCTAANGHACLYVQSCLTASYVL